MYIDKLEIFRRLDILLTNKPNGQLITKHVY